MSAVEIAIEEDTIQTRVAELAALISGDYAARMPVFVGVLSGSLWFLADLVRRLDIPCDVDFLLLNRFGEGGRIRIAADTGIPLIDRDVIIVEDIIDTGLSLTVLRSMMDERGVASVATVALLDKITRRLVDVPIEYRGFEVGDEYLLGYGLDHGGIYRNVRDIWAVMDLPAFLDDPAMLSRQLFLRS